VPDILILGMPRSVFLFGNGISIGFHPDLTLDRITERVRRHLGVGAQELATLAQLAYPDDVAGGVGVNRGNFETLAGPLDRLAEVMVAVDRLVRNQDLAVTRTLRQVSDELRRLYLRVVGNVLREIDHLCVDRNGGDERIDAWDRVNAFAERLHERHGAVGPVTIFTVNYDSLLMSALLHTAPNGRYVYDGFRGGQDLNEPLDRWQEIALYHLHGSISWRFSRDGRVFKTEMDRIRQERVLDSWSEGNAEPSLPAVVLTDRKMTAVGSHPFALFYDELDRELDEADAVVVGGYSFGDRPVNAALARFLLGDDERRIRVWSPSAPRDRPRVLERLRAASPPSRRIEGNQVVCERMTLPDAGAINRLAPHH
jgi:hypothetical protein